MPRKNPKSNISNFIEACKLRKFTSVDVFISYRVSPLTNRVATFDWMFSKEKGRLKSEYVDIESACWFDDGYPLPSFSENAMSFSYSSERTGSQFERVEAFLKNMLELSSNNIEIENYIGHEIGPILDWLNLVIECILDEKKREQFDSMFKCLPKTKI